MTKPLLGRAALKGSNKTGQTDPDQHQRFVEMARELGCDESGEAYRRALDVIVRAPRVDEPSPPPTEGKRPRGRPRKAKAGES